MQQVGIFMMKIILLNQVLFITKYLEIHSVDVLILKVLLFQQASDKLVAIHFLAVWS